MGQLNQKLDIVEHTPENISHMRGIEWFYDEVFKGIYGENVQRGTDVWMEVKNKMQMFSVAYELAKKDSPKTFKSLQKKLQKRIFQIQNRSNGDFLDKDKEFNNIINLLLKEIYGELAEAGKLGILQNIIGGYVNNLGKYTELEQDFEGCIIEERKNNKEDVNETLGSQGYTKSQNKSRFLMQNHLSYKRGVEVYYDKVKEKCFSSEERENDPDGVAEKMQMLNLAYTISKYKFQYVERKSGGRYFEHLLAVVDLYLDNEKQPSFEGVMIALLHDIIEDSDIDKETLDYLFGRDIASSVNHLSKPSVHKFLKDDDEEEKFEEWREKGFLNKDYQTSDNVKRRRVTGCLEQWELDVSDEYDIC